MRYFRFFFFSFLLLALDQVSKLLVYFYMEEGLQGQIIVFDDWFRLYYILNPGMAFGWEFDFPYGKFMLTSFRLIVAFGLAVFLYKKISEKSDTFLSICLAGLLAGTVGNLIDSIFYGVFLEGNAISGAFTPWFHGQVIDMLYFPIFEGILPDWIPFWKGSYFLFFSPVFNLADSFIFISIVSLIIIRPLVVNRRNVNSVTSQNLSTKETIVMSEKAD